MLKEYQSIYELMKLDKSEFIKMSDLSKNIIHTFEQIANNEEILTNFFNYVKQDNTSIQKANLKSNIVTRIKWLSKYYSIRSEHLKISKYQVKKIFKYTKNIVALIVARQSVDKGYTHKQDFAVQNGIRYAEQNNLVYDILRTTATGLTFASKLRSICENNTQIKHLFLESADRLSRNILDCALFLDYCSKNRISIYINGQLMNRGQNRLLLFTSIIFADKQLTDNQTTFNNISYNLVKFELGLLEHSCLNDEEKKLFDKMQNVTTRDFLIKTMQLSEKYVNNYESGEIKKNGTRKANNESHYNKAKEIIELVKNSDYYNYN